MGLYDNLAAAKGDASGNGNGASGSGSTAATTLRAPKQIGTGRGGGGSHGSSAAASSSTAWASQRMGSMMAARRHVSAAAKKATVASKTQPQLQQQQQQQQQPPQRQPRRARFSEASQPIAGLVQQPESDTSESASSSVEGFQDTADPYDPATPNEYLDYCEERLEAQRRKERERELKLLMEEQEAQRARRDKERSEIIRKIQEEAANAKLEGRAMELDHVAARAGVAAAGGRGAGRGRGRGLSNLPAWMTEQQQGQGQGQSHAPAPGGLSDQHGRAPMSVDSSPDASGRFADAAQQQGGPPSSGGTARGGGGGGGEAGGMEFAAGYMAKMGHKEGQGLGRGGQGISQPLVAENHSGGKGSVRFAQEDAKKRSGGAGVGMLPPPVGSTTATPKKKGLFSNPTSVVLLKNMVGPGEVDAELELETKEECERYGPVKRVKVFESKGPGVVPEEAVRIFVAFERQESAVKCFLDMSGRFFGGRQLTTIFYDEGRFDREDLARGEKE